MWPGQHLCELLEVPEPPGVVPDCGGQEPGFSVHDMSHDTKRDALKFATTRRTCRRGGRRSGTPSRRAPRCPPEARRCPGSTASPAETNIPKTNSSPPTDPSLPQLAMQGSPLSILISALGLNTIAPTWCTVTPLDWTLTSWTGLNYKKLDWTGLNYEILDWTDYF